VPVPRLLASVKDPDEARAVLREGADVLDAKDPTAGPLGPCAPAVLRAIAAERDAFAGGRDAFRGDERMGIWGRVPLSAALGDARDLGGDPGRPASQAAACGLDYLKVGLGGVAGEDEAAALLRAVAAGVSARAPEVRGAASKVATGVRVIAATYADAGAADALPLRLLPRVAGRAGISGCLVDTALKDGRTLLDHLSPAELSRFVADCRERGLLCALAGSLAAAHLPLLAAIGPDFIGVRGALCDGGRAGRLDPGRLGALRAALLAAAPR
jgi:uncharacterized protein (UPF0264 family)